MAEFVDMYVAVGGRTDKAVQLTFHEDLPEEQEIWVPLNLIEDPDVLDDLDDDGNCTVSVKRWFLKKSDIPYEGSEDE